MARGGLIVPLHDFDRQLISRCLRHEPGSWVDFVDRYMGLIYHVIHHVAYSRRVVLNAADVEDICAEIFLRIVDDDYALLRQFEGKSALPTYLTVVARRICVKEVIRRQREASLGHADAHRASLAEEEAEPIEPVGSPEVVEQITQNLTEREVRVVRLYHLSMLNSRQISKQVGIPEYSVNMILAKAQTRLQESTPQRSAQS